MDECHIRIILIGSLYSYHIAQVRKTMPFVQLWTTFGQLSYGNI